MRLTTTVTTIWLSLSQYLLTDRRVPSDPPSQPDEPPVTPSSDYYAVISPDSLYASPGASSRVAVFMYNKSDDSAVTTPFEKFNYSFSTVGAITLGENEHTTKNQRNLIVANDVAEGTGTVKCEVSLIDDPSTIVATVEKEVSIFTAGSSANAKWTNMSGVDLTTVGHGNPMNLTVPSSTQIKLKFYLSDGYEVPISEVEKYYDVKVGLSDSGSIVNTVVGGKEVLFDSSTGVATINLLESAEGAGTEFKVANEFTRKPVIDFGLIYLADDVWFQFEDPINT